MTKRLGWFGIVSLLVSSALGAETKTNGFILNDQTAAFKTAKEEGKLLMIDFFGIWCPPCNQLDEHVFSSPEFGKRTDRFVKLKLDADADVSWELKSKFKVQGYPTVVFATPEGDEVGRIVGYRPLAGFLKEADQAWANREKSYAKLAAAAKAGDLSAAAKIGLIEFERGNDLAAKTYLSQSKDPKFAEKIAIANIRLLEERADSDPKTAKELATALSDSIRDFPGTPESIDRRISLAEKEEKSGNSSRKIALLKDGIRVAEGLIKKPSSLDGLDYTPADLWVSIAQANESLKNAVAAKKAWLRAAKEYRGQMKSEDERGYSLELAYCLWKAGSIVDAELIYRKFENKYPSEFTFYHAHANMYYELNKLPDALLLQEKAFAFSYGDNKLRAGYNLARIWKAQGKKTEAIKVLEKTLSEVKLPADSSLRTHRSAKRIEGMLVELRAKI